MASIVVVKLKVRRGTDTQRKSIILDQGELGYTTDTARLFVGTGTEYGGVVVGNIVHQPLTTSGSRTGLVAAVRGDLVYENNFIYQLSGTYYNQPDDWGFIGTKPDNQTLTYNASRTLEIKNNGITATKFDTSAAYSLGGLSVSTTQGLSANVDNSTLGITNTNKLSVINIDETHIKSSSLSNGLTGGSGSKIKLSVDNSYFGFTSAGALTLSSTPPITQVTFSSGILSAIGSGLSLNNGTLSSSFYAVDNSSLTNTDGVLSMKTLGNAGETFHFSSVLYNEYGQVIGGGYTITGVMSARNINPLLSAFNGVPDQQDLALPYSTNLNTLIPAEYTEIDTGSGNLSTYSVTMSSAGFLRFAQTSTRDNKNIARFAIPVYVF